MPKVLVQVSAEEKLVEKKGEKKGEKRVVKRRAIRLKWEKTMKGLEVSHSQQHWNLKRMARSLNLKEQTVKKHVMGRESVKILVMWSLKRRRKVSWREEWQKTGLYCEHRGCLKTI